MARANVRRKGSAGPGEWSARGLVMNIAWMRAMFGRPASKVGRNPASRGSLWLIRRGAVQLTTSWFFRLGQVGFVPRLGVAMGNSSLVPERARSHAFSAEISRPNTTSFDAWSRLLWPIFQQGVTRIVCRFSTDRSRCAAIAKFTGEFSNARASGGVLFALGLVSDAWQMKMAIGRSVATRTLRPAAAQATRSLTTWGAVWAGAELLGIGGALAGIETGPGVVVTSGVGAIVGGFLGLFASNWLAKKIELARPVRDQRYRDSQDSVQDCAC